MSELVTLVVLGLATGAVYGLAAAGLVLTYRTSGVFNFAHGAVAALGAYAFYELRVLRGIPWPVAALLSVVAGAVVVGVALEMMTRRLVGVPLQLQVGATVGLLLVIQDVVTDRYGNEVRFVPDFLADTTVSFAGARVGGGRLVLLGIGVVASLAMFHLLRSSASGRALRAAVDNPVLLDLTGTDPIATRRLAWVLGSGFALGSGILLAPTLGLEPLILAFLVVQAFGAAAIGRFSNLALTAAGGLLVGIAASLATRYVEGPSAMSGLASSVPFLILYIAVLIAPPRPVRVMDRAGREPAARISRRVAPRRQVVWLAGAVAAILVVPGLAGARLPVFTSGAALVVVFLSLALLVNLSGQVSLCHGVFCAVGASTIGHIGASLPWPLGVVAAGAAAIPLGLLIAIPAARLAGLPLAVGTLALAVVGERLLYPLDAFFGTSGTIAVSRAGVLTSDVAYFRATATVALAATVLVTLVGRSRLARLAAAVADDPVAAESLGVTTSLTRLLTFGVSAFLAGVGGALIAGVNGAASAAAFPPLWSLVLVAVLAIAGTGLVGCSLRAAVGFGIVPVYLEPLIGERIALLVGLLAVVAVLVRARPGPLVATVNRLAEGARWRVERGPVQARTAAP